MKPKSSGGKSAINPSAFFSSISPLNDVRIQDAAGEGGKVRRNVQRREIEGVDATAFRHADLFTVANEVTQAIRQNDFRRHCSISLVKKESERQSQRERLQVLPKECERRGESQSWSEVLNLTTETRRSGAHKPVQAGGESSADVVIRFLDEFQCDLQVVGCSYRDLQIAGAIVADVAHVSGD